MVGDSAIIRLSSASSQRHVSAVILLVGSEGSPCLQMAPSLRARGHSVVCASTKDELKKLVQVGQNFSLAWLDLTKFTADDLPLLVQLGQLVDGNGLIIWFSHSRKFRTDFRDFLVQACGDLFVLVN